MGIRGLAGQPACSSRVFLPLRYFADVDGFVVPMTWRGIARAFSRYSYEDVLAVPGCGPGTAGEVRGLLYRYGLDFSLDSRTERGSGLGSTGSPRHKRRYTKCPTCASVVARNRIKGEERP